jgi:ribosomal protein S17E
MGKIKSKSVKRAARELQKKGIKFSKNFEVNNTLLGSNTMPSKKIRNRLAGHMVRVERNKEKV